MQLHSESYGHGPPLIILHGLFGSLENWHSISRNLASDFQVIAVDQRNHGRSPHTAEMSFQFIAEDLKELLAAQHLGPVKLLGHSMGGKTAMVFALSYPDLVEKLIVVDIAPRAYPDGAVTRKRADAACDRTSNGRFAEHGEPGAHVL